MRGDEADFNSRNFAHLEDAVRELMGFGHVVPTHQGRAAENLVMEVLVPPDSIVLASRHEIRCRGPGRRPTGKRTHAGRSRRPPP